MAWIYLAESVDYPLPLHHGPNLWPIVKATDTAKACSCPECGRVTLRAPQSGTMCGRCIQNHLEARSTLSGEDFLAKISPSLELDMAWTASDQDSLVNYSALLAIASPDSSSWKTFQLSLLGDLTEYSWDSMRWGMMRGGQLSQPRRWEPSTFVNDGFYLPTPTACDYGKNVGRKSDGITPSGRDRWSLTVRARRGELPGHPKGSLNPEWVEQAMGYPIGWTVTMDSATPLYRKQRVKRSCVSVEQT